MLGPFDLSPVTAAAKHVELGSLNQLKEAKTIGGRNHAVLTTVKDQSFVRQPSDRGLVRRQGFDPTLPWRREQAGIRFLKSRLNTRAVAQPHELIGNQVTVEGEEIKQTLHVFKRRLITPHCVQTRRYWERDTNTAAQHQPPYALGPGNGGRERHRPSE